MKVLITDIQYRKTFDVASIIKQHFSIEDLLFAVEKNTRRQRIKGNLLYGAKNLVQLRKQRGLFEKDLHKIASSFPGEKIVYIPIEEDTTVLFFQYLEKYGAENFVFSLPEASVYELSRNKEKLNLFCQEHQIKAPVYISEADFKEGNLDLPIIVKPKKGSGAEGIQYIEDEKSLQALKNQNLDFGKYFVQEKLPESKNVVGGFYLCEKGELISYYSHKRIRTYPEEGGVTVFSKTQYIEEIKEMGVELLKRLNWDGLAMVEFLKDPRDGQYKVIEINPRLWGSIMLSEFNNSKIISNYIALQTGKPIPKEETIREDTFIRWIFPYDVIFWLKNKCRPLNYFATNKNTCYINMTYTKSWRSFLFILTQVFNKSNLKKIFR